jgi:hypothetical protein
VQAVDSPAGGLPDGVVVSQNPVDWTPQVLDGRVDAIALTGDRVVVGGSFSRVRQAGSSTVLKRRNLFAFNAATGAVDPRFVPDPDNDVSAVVSAPDGRAVFVGGLFGRIAGRPASRLAKLDVADGRPTPGFRVAVTWRVDDLAVSGSRLFVAGGITAVNGAARSGLAAVDAGTGVLDPGVAVPFTNPRRGLLFVNRLAVRHDGSRLVALGSFTRVAGQSRPQIAVLDISEGGVRLAAWQTNSYGPPCSPDLDTYMRGVGVSGDGSYMVIVTTGHRARPLCDSAARFELNVNGSDLRPTWVDYTGGDTLTGVGVTDAAVYVGGHPRWMNNPYNHGTGLDAKPGVGSVRRWGMAALDPANGLPLPWNPVREPRGLGVFAFLATPQGLWVGSDTDNIGGEYHPRLAMMPVKGGTRRTPPVAGRLPGALYAAGAGGDRRLSRQTFDGQRLGPTNLVGGTVDWSKARGVFAVDGNVYAGWADGRLDIRHFDGTAFGPATALNLGGLSGLPAAMFPVSKLTGMAFDDRRGRIYYTIDGDHRLFYRYFTPDGGVVGGQPFVVGGPTDGVDWQTVRGLALAADRLYFARTDGRLYRVTMRDGSPVRGTLSQIDHRRNWASRGLFLFPR